MWDWYDNKNKEWLNDTINKKIITKKYNFPSYPKYPKEKINKNLVYSYWVALSGTPFQALLSGEYLENEMYLWTYEDEQKAKKSWDSANGKNPWADMADMFWFTYQFSNLIKMQANINYTDDEQFNLNKMFAADENGFENNRQVENFLNLLSPVVSEDNFNLKLSNVSPWYNDNIKDISVLNHTLWVLPSIAACRQLKKKLNNHDYFKRYHVIDEIGRAHV